MEGVRILTKPKHYKPKPKKNPFSTSHSFIFPSLIPYPLIPYPSIPYPLIFLSSHPLFPHFSIFPSLIPPFFHPLSPHSSIPYPPILPSLISPFFHPLFPHSFIPHPPFLHPLQATLARNATDEGETRILYECLAEASEAFPRVFPVMSVALGVVGWVLWGLGVVGVGCGWLVGGGCLFRKKLTIRIITMPTNQPFTRFSIH